MDFAEMAPYYENMLTERFGEALAFANEVHRGQLRKGTQVPYIAHLMGVASIALNFGADEDEAIGALLHDAVEDQGGPPMLEEIRRRFGPRVAEIVDGCTDSWTTPKPPWLPRKRAYIDHVRSASASVRLVSAADKLYNVRAIVRDYRRVGDAVWLRFSASPADVLWYYQSLAEIFSQGRDDAIGGELKRAVAELRGIVEGTRP
jgi:(p)ppGpp synthase/HD superfamily hydrolase